MFRITVEYDYLRTTPATEWAEYIESIESVRSRIIDTTRATLTVNISVAVNKRLDLFEMLLFFRSIFPALFQS